MRLLIDDDSTCSKDRACAQQPDKTQWGIGSVAGAVRAPVLLMFFETGTPRRWLWVK